MEMATGIVMGLVIGFAIGFWFGRDDLVDRLTRSAGMQSPERLDGKTYFIIPDEQYSEFLVADLYHKRNAARDIARLRDAA